MESVVLKVDLLTLITSQVYVKANKKKLGKVRPFQSAVGKSNDQIENGNSDQMVPVFSLMCPGISLSTLSHELRLLDILKFKDICNRVAVTIEYDDDPDYSDVNVIDNQLIQRTKFEVVNNTLVQRTNENEYSREHPYSPNQIYYPPLKLTTDLVGDTDMISSFLEAQKITDVTWLHWWDNWNYREDIVVSPFGCDEGKTNKGYQCVPAQHHVPYYIFTRYPFPKTGLEM